MEPGWDEPKGGKHMITIELLGRTTVIGEHRSLSTRELGGVKPRQLLEMLALERAAAVVLTDSGGLQEESCYFRVPCVTLRANTERPETLQIGANLLAGTDPNRILSAVRRQLIAPRGWPNPYGDGRTSGRIARIIAEFLR